MTSATDVQREVAAASPGAAGRSRASIVFYVVLALLAALMVYRAAYGIEWYGDEAYSLGTASRYAAGDHPITQSWESHFSSGMLLTPFVWVLRRAAPDGTGIVLLFRYLFVVLNTLYAVAVWRLIRGLVPPWAAVLTTLTLYLYLPYFYVFPYYNSMMVWGFTLSSLLLLRGFSVAGGPSRTRYLVASGVLSGLGTIAYPTMLLALPFFCAGIWLAARASGEGGAPRQPLVRYLAGLVATLGVFAVVLLVSSGFRDLGAALPYFLHPTDRDMSPGAMAYRIGRTWSVLITPAVTLAAFGIASLATRARRSPVAAAAVATVTAALTAFVLYKFKFTFLSYLDIPQSVALAIGCLAPLMALRLRDARTRQLVWLLSLPALGLGVGTLLASYEGFETAAMPSIIALVATYAVMALAARDGAADSGPGGAAGRPRLTDTRLVVAAMAAVAVFSLYTTMQYVGGDSAVRQLDTRMVAGPYAGIRTTAANAAWYAAYLEVLAPLRASTGRIAFVEEFPQGYLLTGRPPGTYSVWTTFSTGGRWQAYLDITGLYPDDIVSTTFKGPNGGFVATPFAPPFGLRDFAKKYTETYRDADLVIYSRNR